MMMSTPKSTGRATSTAALRNRLIRSSCAWDPWVCDTRSPTSARRRTKFSIITTAPSTMSPKSMAPSDIRLADTPKRRMPMNPTSIESGITAATISEARTSRRKKKSTTRTNPQPSRRFRVKVAVVRPMTSLWS